MHANPSGNKHKRSNGKIAATAAAQSSDVVTSIIMVQGPSATQPPLGSRLSAEAVRLWHPPCQHVASRQLCDALPRPICEAEQRHLADLSENDPEAATLSTTYKAHS